MNRCPRASDTAVHVLGGLDATEEEEFGRHLDGCHRCRADVEELVPVAQLLALACRYRAGPEQA